MADWNKKWDFRGDFQKNRMKNLGEPLPDWYSTIYNIEKKAYPNDPTLNTPKDLNYSTRRAQNKIRKGVDPFGVAKEWDSPSKSSKGPNLADIDKFLNMLPPDKKKKILDNFDATWKKQMDSFDKIVKDAKAGMPIEEIKAKLAKLKAEAVKSPNQLPVDPDSPYMQYLNQLPRNGKGKDVLQDGLSLSKQRLYKDIGDLKLPVSEYHPGNSQYKDIIKGIETLPQKEVFNEGNFKWMAKMNRPKAPGMPMKPSVMKGPFNPALPKQYQLPPEQYWGYQEAIPWLENAIQEGKFPAAYSQGRQSAENQFMRQQRNQPGGLADLMALGALAGYIQPMQQSVNQMNPVMGAMNPIMAVLMNLPQFQNMIPQQSPEQMAYNQWGPSMSLTGNAPQE